MSGSSVGALVREAIDRVILDEDEERASAGAGFLAAAPMKIGEPVDLERELDGLFDRGAGHGSG